MDSAVSIATVSRCINDPEQLVNLAGNPEFSEVRENLAALLMEQLEITGDPRVVGGAERFDEVPYLGMGPRHPSYKP